MPTRRTRVTRGNPSGGAIAAIACMSPTDTAPWAGDVLFRILEPHEIGRGMAFADDYVVVGSKRDRVRQYGNAVTPPVAELIVSALVETITGQQLERNYGRSEGLGL